MAIHDFSDIAGPEIELFPGCVVIAMTGNQFDTFRSDKCPNCGTCVGYEKAARRVTDAAVTHLELEACAHNWR